MAKTVRKGQPQENLKALRDRAEKFGISPGTTAAIRAVLAKPEGMTAAIKDPRAFFSAHGVKIPPSLEVELFDREPLTIPGPDWTPFVVELFNCRRFFVRTCDDATPPVCRWREETVCFGIRIFPTHIPGPR